MQLTRSARKQLRRLPDAARGRVKERLAAMDNGPVRGKWIEGMACWSIRLGDYRILFTQEPLEVIAIGHRGQVYKGTCAGEGGR